MRRHFWKEAGYLLALAGALGGLSYWSMNIPRLSDILVWLSALSLVGAIILSVLSSLPYMLRYTPFLVSLWLRFPLVGLKPVVEHIEIVSGENDEFFDEETGQFQQAVICWKHPDWATPDNCQWVWISHKVCPNHAINGYNALFRRCFEIGSNAIPWLSDVRLVIWVDNEVTFVRVNGRKLKTKEPVIGFRQVASVLDIARLLKPGSNVLELIVRNYPMGPHATPEINPAGVAFNISGHVLTLTPSQ